MKFVNNIKSNVKGHSPTYLAASGCVGVITTAVLAARAGHRSNDKSRYDTYHLTGLPEHKREFLIGYFKLVYREYIPVGISGVVTIGCILGGNRLGVRRTMAAQTLFVAAERAYSAYRDEVIREHGPKQDQAIRDRMAERAVAENPPPQILVGGMGEVRCFESYTGRYFMSSMERLKKAMNDLNAKLLRDDYCTLDEWYYLLGIPYTSSSSEVGWRSDKLMDLSFHAMMYDDAPVMAFEYQNLRHL